MAHVTQTDVTRRQMLKVGASAAAAAGYAISVETVLAQAVKTDTKGIVAGDHNQLHRLDTPVKSKDARHMLQTAEPQFAQGGSKC